MRFYIRFGCVSILDLDVVLYINVQIVERYQNNVQEFNGIKIMCND